ncbi:MAG: hypothetical protein KME56_17465 [Candidatus Thiodiazotropha sp. (ex Ctena orbiculata)]|nr:hypothetical protein [Candidatus Thiodiazotropha taylori]MBT2998405.1 hypothetical protein [Candidatus Thiodiazotropha taylori]MBT3002695.1 hypothetical protein [Candidatus Thiodiazotropha taylori]MBV2109138.1 hypothetical protein [Candidatus Thiodiazotropha taylori]MBV2112923.1 hypothetical protein [Candidatus Thiodiazotropha taylori]
MSESANSKVDRSVIAYAFLAQATRGEGDLFSGLTPIFKPIAKIHAGEIFEIEEFSSLVDQLYGLKVHPWAVEDLIPRLEKAGLILRIQRSEDIHEFVYSEISEEFDEVTESDIKYIIKRFMEFSTKILNQNNLPVDESALEDGFLTQLVDMSFVSILLKPDRSKEDTRGSGTLSLKKPKEQSDWEEDVMARSKVDILCASFIIDAFYNDPSLYDLVMRIATGAILSEVILNLQDPGETVTLKDLNVVLDAPFLMSALNLTSEESYKFSIEICELLREKGAKLVTFDHSIDELKDNLKAVITKTKDGTGIGATARRLKSTSFAAYANTVLQNTDTVLKRENIKKIVAPKSNLSFQYFTEADQEGFEHSLGFYQNRTAQQRDAESVSAIIRLRRGKQVKMGRLHTSDYIFITENTWVVKQATRFLKRRNLFNDGEVPPAISEKYLAGLLWAMYGGKGNELTRHLLLANCAAALEPRNDVIAQMHRFLSEIDEKQAEVFNVLMTEERAGQYAMQLTLGDSSFITKDNAPDVLGQIKKALIEKHETDKKTEIESLLKLHETELGKRDEVSDRLRHKLLDANSESLETRSQLKDTKKRVEQIEAALEAEKCARIDEKKRLVERCVNNAVIYEKRIYLIVGFIIAAITGLIAWFELLNSQVLWIKASAVIFFTVITALFLWKVPDHILADWFHNLRAKKFKSCLEYLGIYQDVVLFDIDWKRQRAFLRKDKAIFIKKDIGK